MYSCLNRAQAVFGFFTTMALCIASMAALSVLLYPADASHAAVQLKNVQVIKGRPYYYSTKKEQYAQIKFDLDADLSSLFNWNTKQLFVYVLASYPSSPDRTTSSLVPTPSSESIIWDTIIPAPESPYSFASLKERYLPSKASSSSRSSRKRSSSTAGKSKHKTASSPPGILRLRNQRAKYQISDITGKMADRHNVTLSVGWNVQPWVGALWWGPGTGAMPHTKGQVERSEVFDFPALKGSSRSAAAQEGMASSQ